MERFRMGFFYSNRPSSRHKGRPRLQLHSLSDSSRLSSSQNSQTSAGDILRIVSLMKYSSNKLEGANWPHWTVLWNSISDVKTSCFWWYCRGIQSRVCSFISNSSSTEFIPKGERQTGWQKAWRSCSCHLCVRVFTCVLVPALADMRCRVRRGAISPRQEQGCSFYCEKTLTDTGRGEKGKIHEYKFQNLQGYLIISGLSCKLCAYKRVLHLLSLSCTCWPWLLIIGARWGQGTDRVLSWAYVIVTMLHSCDLWSAGLPKSELTERCE